jgi:transcription initiation factor IIE alpha subunit
MTKKELISILESSKDKNPILDVPAAVNNQVLDHAIYLAKELDEPKECEWKENESNGYFCSNCHYDLMRTHATDNFNYCPNCGAKIKKEIK